jgi:dihydropteroate synthase
MISVNTEYMGILNLTPDSFSDGGRFEGLGGAESVAEVAKQMVKDGALYVDIGGESTGPGSVEVSEEEELARVIPAIRAVRAALPNVRISVDTWKSEVARQATLAGANMVNDVTAGRGDAAMFSVVAAAGVPMVLMYSKQNSPRTDREVVDYEDVMKTVKDFLRERVAAARVAGVKEVIVDPGMGAFVSGEPKYSFELIERIEELRELGCPIFVGTSRKGFLGEDKLGMTLWSTLQLRGKVDILRVHDVFENVTAE